ncbi:MAG: hypothetical protein IPG34_19925 [Rhodocyclaceae bacterium]|nr:hypothetical protein [Rhodocyclaceae bacterium]
MALDRRELLRRIGMGGMAVALTPMAGMAPSRSDGMVALPKSQEIELLPASVITPELVRSATYDGWMLTQVMINHTARRCTTMNCEFVHTGGEWNDDPLAHLSDPDSLYRWGIRP